MGSNDTRNRRKNVLKFSILITINILLSIGNYLCINNYKNIENINLDYQNQLKDQKIQLQGQEEIIKTLEENNILINNIDNEINQTRMNYYKILKEFETKVLNGEVNYKIAYLTFDDGPYHLTHSFLDILDNYNVKATFFTIGLNKEICYDNKSMYCGDVYEKIHKKGHTLANHTYSHQIFNGLYSSVDSFINNVKTQEEFLKQKTGVVTNIVRFPGGSASSRGLKDGIISRLREIGYGWVDWTCMNGDGGYISGTYEAFNNFKNGIDQNVEVILLHDYSYITLSILPDIIEYLKNNNYVLLPLFYESNMINK